MDINGKLLFVAIRNHCLDETTGHFVEKSTKLQVDH